MVKGSIKLRTKTQENYLYEKNKQHHSSYRHQIVPDPGLHLVYASLTVHIETQKRRLPGSEATLCVNDVSRRATALAAGKRNPTCLRDKLVALRS